METSKTLVETSRKPHELRVLKNLGKIYKTKHIKICGKLQKK